MSGIHKIFHVSQLMKCISDESHVLEVEILMMEGILIGELKHEEVPIGLWTSRTKYPEDAPFRTSRCKGLIT